MISLQPHLDALLKSLPPAPVDQSKLDGAVVRVLKDTKDNTWPENRKTQWEHVLRNDIFQLAATEGIALKKGSEQYYFDLSTKLDLVLTFTEHDVCEPNFPFYILQDVLEIQTIQSCSHVFSWIESRTARLTKDMVPQKGKALVLLRTLNDLLRRLSKMGANTIFCGRILTFLSGVFPLGERSGVNLRGEYGPVWEGVQFHDKQKHKEEDEVMKVDAEGPSIPEEDKMQVDSKKELTEEEKKEEVYNTFWSLQTWFAKPPLFANKDALGEFKDAVTKVIPIIKEATAKERAMMGSRTSNGAAVLKRKREPEEETNLNEYFFAKFLTSPDLLDLEIADTHFRRQILFQLLVLLNHLLNFTPSAKAAWFLPRNRSLQMEFTLEEQDARWVSDTINKVLDELKQTSPNGRVFADTVHTILDREKNWTKWKNELCTPFDKEPYSEEMNGEKVGLFEATAEERRKMREPPPDWKYKLGTESLTEIWEDGYTELGCLQDPVPAGDINTFAKKIKLENFNIGKRERMLAAQRARAAPVAAPAPAPTPAAPLPAITITQDQPEKSENATDRIDSVPGLVAPRPISANSSLHPSLPPKPSRESAENGSSAATTPVPQPAPETVPTPTPVVEKPVIPLDPQIAALEENKVRWAWLGLRSARDIYLQHFGKIGGGDIELLVKEIEKDKLEKEKVLRGEVPAPEGTAVEENEAMSPGAVAPPPGHGTESNRRAGDSDTKMDTA
ncbi:hypothetical protein D9619_002707 [Psilocybe cf. subviscida]|uniref:THO complex subunit 1 n=1 Tax=Psilocybe cf. subviscida TaxID=2480587 RepID=A0A8H5ETR0_9AGAR|nr:hypothetical protein D9619_002707 [Psilocybe cf. subviscida]